MPKVAKDYAKPAKDTDRIITDYAEYRDMMAEAESNSIAARKADEMPDGLGSGPDRFGELDDAPPPPDLVDKALIVEWMKADGYSLTKSEGMLNVGRAVHFARRAAVKGPEALAKAPIIHEGKARVKSDNGRPTTKMIHASRREKIGMEGEIRKAEDTGKFEDGTKLSKAQRAWLETLDGEVQSQSRKTSPGETDWEWL